MYQFAVSALTYFAVVADLGVTSLAVRDVARGVARPADIAGEVVMIRLTLAAGAFAAVLVLAPQLSPTHRHAVVLSILAVTLLADAYAGDWLLQADGRLGVLAAVAVGRQMIIVVFTGLLLTRGYASVERYVAVVAAAEAVGAGATAYAASHFVGLPRLTFDLRRIVRRWRRGLPFAWTFVMIQVYYATDSLLLTYLRNTRTVGIYGAAYRLPLVVIGVVSLWSTAMYPHLARRFGSTDSINRDVGSATSISIVIALALIAITAPTGSRLMPEIFGSTFASAGLPFVILMGNAALIIVSVNLMNALLAVGDERHYARAVTAGAIVNTVLNVVLIPAIGAAGAATATLAAELCVLFYMGFRIRSTMAPLDLDLRRIRRGTAAATAAAGVVLMLPSASIPALVATVVGGIVFIALALAGRVVTVDELLVWRRTEEPRVDTRRPAS
jgi:O-antigen/teichoic acid export membrane protein